MTVRCRQGEDGLPEVFANWLEANIGVTGDKVSGQCVATAPLAGSQHNGECLNPMENL